jgi:hypothetical protein
MNPPCDVAAVGENKMSTTVPHATASPQSLPPDRAAAGTTPSGHAQSAPEPKKPQPVGELRVNRRFIDSQVETIQRLTSENSRAAEAS